jgi:hypothetical protein
VDSAARPVGLSDRGGFFREAEDGVSVYATHVFGLEQKHDDGRTIRTHLAKLAKRGDAEAIALLRAPDFPSVFSYLFDYFNDFLLWYDRERVPSWSDWQAFAVLMQHPVTPWDVRMLRQIHDAYFAPKKQGA